MHLYKISFVAKLHSCLLKQSSHELGLYGVHEHFK